ncbi:MAG: DUF5076 domain-containing protein [Brevundimonas sp.]|nr:MAG: DUF5076 domain-containing protein [Brevundimonas sp.]
MNALPLPEGLQSEPADAVTEIIRVWWNETQPAMIIRPALRDPATVGTVLAELAWHFSNAYAETKSMPREETLAAIRAGFDEAMRRIPLDPAEANL